MLPRVMVLFVRKDLKRFGTAPQAIATEIVEGRRIAPGVPLFDLCLLAPRETTPRTLRATARCLESFGWRTTTVRARPPVATPHHRIDAIRAVEQESRALLILAEEGRDLYDPWLAWYLGRCLAAGRPAAVLPLARNDATRRMWRLAGPVAPLPYCGYARAAGEQQYSLWIVPAGAPPESRDAENIDYWIARARLSR